MTIVTSFVAGFVFQGANDITHASKVLLCYKRKPDWQAGLLNAIGGKIEDGETAYAAMDREAREEARGLSLGNGLISDWHKFAVERLMTARVTFFRALADPAWVPPACNDVGETMGWVEVDLISAGPGTLSMIGNLHWLIPLAMDPRYLESVVVDTDDSIKENPSW